MESGASQDAPFLFLGEVLEKMPHGKSRTSQTDTTGDRSSRTADSTRDHTGGSDDRSGGGQDLGPFGAVFAVDLGTYCGTGKAEYGDPRKAGTRTESLPDEPAGASHGRTRESR